MQTVKFLMLTVFAASIFACAVANPLSKSPAGDLDQKSDVPVAMALEYDAYIPNAMALKSGEEDSEGEENSEDSEGMDDMTILIFCVACGIGLTIIALVTCWACKGCSGGAGGEVNCGNCCCVYRVMHNPNDDTLPYGPTAENQEDGSKDQQTVVFVDPDEEFPKKSFPMEMRKELRREKE